MIVASIKDLHVFLIDLISLAFLLCEQALRFSRRDRCCELYTCVLAETAEKFGTMYSSAS